MSDYQAQEIEVTAVSRPSSPAIVARLRANALPCLFGVALAIVAHAGLVVSANDVAIRVTAAWAGTACWLYLVWGAELRPPLAVVNVATVAGLFALALLGLSQPWTLPLAYAGHASWSWILDRKAEGTPGITWAALHATLAITHFVL